MTSDLKTSLVASLESAAANAGLVLVSVKQGADFHGQPTAVFELGLPGARGRRPLAQARTERRLRLRQAKSAARDDRASCRRGQAAAQSAARLLRHARRPALAFGKFQWPFHRSTSGADTYIVHGEIQLADGRNTACTPKSPPASRSPSPKSSPPWSSPTQRPSSTTPSAKPSTWASSNS